MTSIQYKNRERENELRSREREGAEVKKVR